ncbi:MAG: DEAD/DEAH box helicase, partial [Acidobacteriota bacterium]|nr:DEAD/DEAH box helicase [Acidobacteriota bacterium]
MSLTRALQDEFPPEVRERGREYFQTKRVRLVVSRPALLVAEVQGGDSYKVYLTPDGYREYGAHCSCTAFSRYDSCKHLWAALLEADSRRFSWLAEAKAGYLVPMEVSDFLDDQEQKGPASSWRARVSEVRATMRESLGSDTTVADFEVLYILDVDDALEHGSPVIELCSRRRRANGDWGTLRAFRPAPEELQRLPEAVDRQIIGALHGARPESERNLYSFTSADEVTNRYVMDGANAGLLVPLLCSTERFFLRRSGALESSPLRWHDGDPWVLGLKVEETETHTEVRGFLQRGEERMRLEEPDVLLMYGQLFASDQAAPFDPRGAFAWVNLLRENDLLKADASERDAVVESILDLPAQPLLELPKPWTVGTAPKPRPRLEVERIGRNGSDRRRIGCRLRFDYRGALVDSGEPRQVLRRPDSHNLFNRNLEAEAEYFARLIELGARRAPALDREYSAYLVPSRFSDLVRLLVGEGWMVRADGRAYHRAGPIRMTVSSGVDWFDVHGEVSFDGQSLSLPELLAAARSGSGTVRLGDGSVGLLPEQWLERSGLLAAFAQHQGENLRFAHSQGFLLDALLAAAEEEAQVDEGFKDFRRRLEGFEGVQPMHEPETFEGTLREYQRHALGWFRFLRQFHLGGCLADDMGLGKTVQVLALLEHQRLDPSDETRTSLVVVPRSLVFNWLREAEHFAPGLTCLDYTGPQRKENLQRIPEVDLVITTYGILRRDILELKKIGFHYVVLDEAQAIKNASSQAAKAARLLTAEHRLALSGTPIENHLGELWSLFEFLNPGMLGKSSTFRKLVSQSNGGSLAEDGRELLARAVRPFILRRTKEQVIRDLPNKVEQTLFCEMEPRQRRLYEELRGHYRSTLLQRVAEQGMGGSQMQVLEALLRLRQASCHPGLIDKERDEETSAKLDVLLPSLLEICDQGHRALVFSQFTSLLAIVRKRLDQAKLPYEYLDGQSRNRQERVERFQSDDGPPVFLISLKAGGLGLNLTAADYVFILDPWWNPAAEAQAIDRAHRIGQTRRVLAYRLICRDTVEEKILELQRQKRDLAEAIVRTDDGMMKNLSREDL